MSDVADFETGPDTESWTGLVDMNLCFNGADSLDWPEYPKAPLMLDPDTLTQFDNGMPADRSDAGKGNVFWAGICSFLDRFREYMGLPP